MNSKASERGVCVCVHLEVEARFFVSLISDLRKANHRLLRESQYHTCDNAVQRAETLCIVPDLMRNSQCPFPSNYCVCVCVCARGMTPVAVCVAMVTLAAGQDRTCQEVERTDAHLLQ